MIWSVFGKVTSSWGKKPWSILIAVGHETPFFWTHQHVTTSIVQKLISGCWIAECLKRQASHSPWTRTLANDKQTWSRFTMCVSNTWWPINHGQSNIWGALNNNHPEGIMLFTSEDHSQHIWPLFTIKMQRKQLYFQCSYLAAIEHSHRNLVFPTRNISTFKIHFLAKVKITRRVNQPELISRVSTKTSHSPWDPVLSKFQKRGWRPITINTFRAMAISMCTDLNPEKKQTTKGSVWGGDRGDCFV